MNAIKQKIIGRWLTIAAVVSLTVGSSHANWVGGLDHMNNQTNVVCNQYNTINGSSYGGYASVTPSVGPYWFDYSSKTVDNDYNESWLTSGSTYAYYKTNSIADINETDYRYAEVYVQGAFAYSYAWGERYPYN